MTPGCEHSHTKYHVHVTCANARAGSHDDDERNISFERDDAV
jgi:hypothetical protein